ncbi:MAG: 5'/3'-nucleotidase SurE [Firmicutes bacterium]|nr:5'/3'-nucleotidase SurE [Bacillota bacterium]
MKRKILITNDDGIHSPALNVLALILAEHHDVVVIAPESERSGYSHAISLKTRLTYKPVEYGSIRAYALSGTPADCVKFGVIHLLKDERPDIVISGINVGANLGSDAMYSGTVAAALEGAYLGVRSIAVSVCSHELRPDLNKLAAHFVRDNLEKFMTCGLPVSTVLNINFPTRGVNGLAVTTQGYNEYNDTYTVDENDPGSFKLVGVPIPHGRNTHAADVEHNKLGHITITPLKLNFTDAEAVEILSKVFEGGESV